MCLWSGAFLYACITSQHDTEAQPDLLYTEESRPARLPVIADSSLPDAPALLIFSAVSVWNAHHASTITAAILLQASQGCSGACMG